MEANMEATFIDLNSEAFDLPETALEALKGVRKILSYVEGEIESAGSFRHAVYNSLNVYHDGLWWVEDIDGGNKLRYFYENGAWHSALK
jgi:hypothetical protein